MNLVLLVNGERSPIFHKLRVKSIAVEQRNHRAFRSIGMLVSIIGGICFYFLDSVLDFGLDCYFNTIEAAKKYSDFSAEI